MEHSSQRTMFATEDEARAYAVTAVVIERVDADSVTRLPLTDVDETPEQLGERIGKNLVKKIFGGLAQP
jgi:hypothetical protein